MFELPPELRKYIIDLVRMRLNLDVHKHPDSELDKILDEIVGVIKKHFGIW